LEEVKLGETLCRALYHPALTTPAHAYMGIKVLGNELIKHLVRVQSLLELFGEDTASRHYCCAQTFRMLYLSLLLAEKTRCLLHKTGEKDKGELVMVLESLQAKCRALLRRDEQTTSTVLHPLFRSIMLKLVE
jgi:hypothetical protein